MASTLFKGSKHALLYSKFRPTPPIEFINSIINYVGQKVPGTSHEAVDIGCGSGQSTIILAPHFKKVIGCDISESQINCARIERSALNIEYRVLDCEELPFPKASIHLVTSSQAVHWFDTEKLFNEVKRILVPNGVIAVYGYWIPFPKTGNEAKDRKLAYLIDLELHEKTLGQYWDVQRYIVKNYYRDITFPFKDAHRLELTKKSECSLADYIGYLSTWSAYQKLYSEDYKKAEKLLNDVEKHSYDDPNANEEGQIISSVIGAIQAVKILEYIRRK